MSCCPPFSPWGNVLTLTQKNEIVEGSGAGTIFQQGGQDQPFPAGGAERPQRGPGQSPGDKRILTTIFGKLTENQVSGSTAG